MLVLGIETSCDETGLAIYSDAEGILAENIYSQVDLHEKYGGVVPELASRDHVRKCLPLIRQTLDEADIALSDLDGIAYTAGPGLVVALLVGATLGRTLAWSLGIKSAAVHHMEAHLVAPMLEQQAPKFPFVALLVSGGHTMLVHVEAIGRYRIIGESRDDAAGEAFDKTAQLLDLKYPGGPEIQKLAMRGQSGNVVFPRPMTDSQNLEFSFSGLKTAVQVKLKRTENITSQHRADIARAFEEAVVDTLAIKCQWALEATKCRRLVLAGGVGANLKLRKRFDSLDADVFYPSLKLCTDNGAMIAYAGFLRLSAGYDEPLHIQTKPRWHLEELDVI